MADAAEPTAFHKLLKSLDDDGKLFRVYTQSVYPLLVLRSCMRADTGRDRNIDGLEEKAGLSYGLGDRSLDLSKRRTSPTKSKSSTSLLVTASPSPSPLPTQAKVDLDETPKPTRRRSPRISDMLSTTPSASTTPSPPPAEIVPPPPSPTKNAVDASGIPRCIPLHGTLSTLYCPHCSHIVPLAPHLPTLSKGSTPACPACLSTEALRAALGDRSRGVGKLKPDVVLYGEVHKEGERVGDITRRDLMGSRPDLLLVVGTSLKIPGVKTLVRELSKVIRPPIIVESFSTSDDEQDMEEMPVASGSTATSTQSSSTTSSTSPSKSKAKRSAKSGIKTIFLNFDFPTPSREWQGVFDAWALGDVQEFVEILSAERLLEFARTEKNRLEKVRATERKLARELKKSSSLVVGAGGAGGVLRISEKRTGKKVISETVVVGKKVLGMTMPPVEKRGGKTKSTAGAGMMRRSRSKSSTSNLSEDSSTVTTRASKGLSSIFMADKPSLRSGRTK